jgi:hypothetical protein
LSSCELGFRYGSLAVFQIQLAHQQSPVPLTRCRPLVVNVGACPVGPAAFSIIVLRQIKIPVDDQGATFAETLDLIVVVRRA